MYMHIYIYKDTYGIRNFLVILQSAVSVVSVVSGQGCLLAKELDASKNFINHTALKMLLTVLKERQILEQKHRSGWFGTWLLWLPFHINGIYNPNPIDELHDFSRWWNCTTNQRWFLWTTWWCRWAELEGVISSNFAVLSRSIRDLTLHLWQRIGGHICGHQAGREWLAGMVGMDQVGQE